MGEGRGEREEIVYKRKPTIGSYVPQRREDGRGERELRNIGEIL